MTYEGLFGNAVPSVPNEQLDSTSTLAATKGAADNEAAASYSGGIGTLPKLVFFGVVGGSLVIFLRARRTHTEKSLA